MALLNWQVWLISILFLVATYLLRFGLFYVIEKKDTMPQTFIAPKGLISILLFFAIPESLKTSGFESGVFFVVIIATSIIMAWSLIATGDKKKRKESDDEYDESAFKIIREGSGEQSRYNEAKD